MDRLSLLFEPCTTREELKDHIKVFLNIDLPDQTIDEDSTSNPLEFVWEIYEMLLTNKGKTAHVAACSRNTAKCLKEGTLVATPTGPVEIQNLKPGDEVFDEHGKPVKVLALHDQGEQDCVNLVHSGAVVATCTPNHIWSTCHIRTPGVWKDRRVEDFYTGIKIKRVELTCDLGKKREPLAYALGALLGDGCSTECGVRISSKNDKIPAKVASVLGTRFTKLTSNNFSYIINSPGGQGVKWHFSDFYEKNIRNLRSYEKTTDLEEIKTWDRQSLVEFVAGLLDTDGSVYMTETTGKQVHFKFCMQSKSTVEAFAWACYALWQVNLRIFKDERDHYVNGPCYCVGTNHIYHVKRMLKELSPHIVTDSKKYKQEYNELQPNNFNPESVGVRIEPAGRFQCWDITVDSPTSLYCLQNGLVTHNTLTSAILHFYAMVHFRRTCLQLAATLDQSVSCLNYLDKFLSIPELAPFSNIDNARTKSLSNMPANSVTIKNDGVIRVAVSTRKGTNSQRCNFLVCDEVDLTPQEILDEVVFVIDPVAYNQYEPVVVWLSSRKTNAGPIQRLIEDAADPDKDVRLHKWSVADWMQKCPESVHMPELPRPTAFINLDNLQVIWDQEHQQSINAQFRSNYREVHAYAGCVKCPAFVVCQARSPRQKSTSKMLRTLKFVGGVLRKVKDVNVIISQYLNWKPETTGIVFKTFSKAKHLKNHIDFYQWACGQRFNPLGLSDEDYKAALESKKFTELKKITPTVDEIYSMLVSRGWDIGYGVDWGFNPAVAVCIVAAYHKKQKRGCVFHVEYANGYDNRSWADHIATHIWTRFPGNFVAPDLEDPAAPAYFGRHKIPTINTKPHLIETGVSQLRGFLWDVVEQKPQFAVLDDPKEESGLRRLVEAFEKWTHRRSPMGFNFDKYEDDEFCDFIDPTRYCFAPYVRELKVSISAGQPSNNPLDRYRAQAINSLPVEQRGAALEAMARGQLEQFFRDTHGLDKIFDREEKLRLWRETQALNAQLNGEPIPEAPEDLKPQGKSGLKISF